MSAKCSPPPAVDPESWRRLLSVANVFAASKPWEVVSDADVVGLEDPATGETRIACLLGNAGQVFGAVFHRRGSGLRWLLNSISDAPDEPGPEIAEGIDCLKLEFGFRRALDKEDLAVLKATQFKPAGKGRAWPQFRSWEPGWHPWFISQAEAEHFLNDLPRLIRFCDLFRANPNLFKDRIPGEIPFLPNPLHDRPLTVADLNWRPVIPPPGNDLAAFKPSDEQWNKVRALARDPTATYEFDCRLLPGASFIDQGRPCMGRCALLMDQRSDLILGAEMLSGAILAGECAGQGLVKVLLQAKTLPGRILIQSARLQAALEPLCHDLSIHLDPVPALTSIEKARWSLSQHLRAKL